MNVLLQNPNFKLIKENNQKKRKKKITNKQKNKKTHSPSNQQITKQRSPHFPQSETNSILKNYIVNITNSNITTNLSNPLNNFFKNNFSTKNEIKVKKPKKKSTKKKTNISSENISDQLLNAFIKKAKKSVKSFQFVNDSFGLTSIKETKNENKFKNVIASDQIQKFENNSKIKSENNQIDRMVSTFGFPNAHKSFSISSLNNKTCFKKKKLLNKNCKKN